MQYIGIQLSPTGMRLSSNAVPRERVSDEKDDRVIRERRFKIGANLDIGDLGIVEKTEKVAASNHLESEKKDIEEVDEALGDIFDLFKEKSGDQAGAIAADGTVASAPEDDIVTSMAKDGERRVNWSLMVSMIFVFSALSVVAGTAFPPMISLVLLLILAGVGFAFGER